LRAGWQPCAASVDTVPAKQLVLRGPPHPSLPSRGEGDQPLRWRSLFAPPRFPGRAIRGWLGRATGRSNEPMEHHMPIALPSGGEGGVGWTWCYRMLCAPYAAFVPPPCNLWGESHCQAPSTRPSPARAISGRRAQAMCRPSLFTSPLGERSAAGRVRGREPLPARPRLTKNGRLSHGGTNHQGDFLKSFFPKEIGIFTPQKVPPSATVFEPFGGTMIAAG
jgi:hypothetical protein